MIIYLLFAIISVITSILVTVIPLNINDLSIVIILLTVGCIILIIIEQLNALNHPLRIIIEKQLSNMPATNTQKYIIFNISNQDIDLSYNPLLNPVLSIQYKKCHLKGYTHSNGNFYLVLSEPNNHVNSMHALFKEITLTQLKFKSIGLLVSPECSHEVEQINQSEWQLFNQIFRNHKVFVSIYDHDLIQSVYYHTSFSHDIPQINIDSKELSNNQLIHQITSQFDQIIQSTYAQRNTTCNQSAVSPDHKALIFSLTYRLCKIKNDTTETMISFIENKINICTLQIGGSIDLLFQPISPQLSFHGILRIITLPMILIAGILYTAQMMLHQHINRTLLDQLTNETELVTQLNNMEQYPAYRSLQKRHIQLLLNKSLSQYPDEQKKLYDYLLHTTQKTSPSFKRWIVSQIIPNIKKESNLMLLVKYWFYPTKQHYQFDISTISRYIDANHTYEVCHVIDPQKPGECAQKVSDNILLQSYHQQLEQIEKTLIPINPNDINLSARQIRYLISNPEHIGKEASKRLEHMIHALSQKVIFSPLKEKATNIKSTIELLKTHQGKYLLSQIDKLFEELGKITSGQQAINLYKNIYHLDEHPYRQIRSIQSRLTPYQSQWIKTMIKPVVNPIQDMANNYLASEWNTNITPLLKKAYTLYPFDPSCHDDITPSAFFQLFGANQLIDDYFNTYLINFTSSDGDILSPKDPGLGINIPNNIIFNVVYAKVLSSSLDIYPDHLHGSWAISLLDSTAPISNIALISNHNTQLNKGSSVNMHWRSDHACGFEVTLQNGEKITLTKEGDWGFYRLMHLFNSQSPHHYKYTDKDHSWHFSVKAIPHLPINLIDIQDVVEHMPEPEWNCNILETNG